MTKTFETKGKPDSGNKLNKNQNKNYIRAFCKIFFQKTGLSLPDTGLSDFTFIEVIGKLIWSINQPVN